MAQDTSEIQVTKVSTPTNPTKKKGQFDISTLSEKQRKDYLFFKTRWPELIDARKSHFGANLDSLWADADKDYIPHRLRNKGTKVIATDEDKGWRGSVITLGSSEWQSDMSQSNPFVKIQVALSTLVDQNPKAILAPTSKRFEASTALMTQLYDRSWRVARSIYQLKLFVFNLAKYGWAVGRTYPLRIERDTQVMTEYNQENPEQSTYEDKKAVEYNDIFREDLDVRNVWIDDMAKPNNDKSVRDWQWRKVYSYDDAKTEFGKYKRFEQVNPGGGGIVTDVLDPKGKNDKLAQGQKGLVEVKFYENRARDVFIVEIAGIPVIIEPLPVSNNKGVKKLTLWQTYWMLRHSESPYGIGIYEAIRYDQAMIDRLSNMTIDQVTLAIYKMFFYQGTQNLQETGDIKITPGVGKQVIDPKSITWLDVPGPGRDSWDAIAYMKGRIDESSGVTDPLLGVVTGKTAFELAQAKESALNRLKGPFDNILEALEIEGDITLCLIQLLYSTPEVYEISDPRLIEDYMNEIGGDTDLYEEGAPQLGADGELMGRSIKAKVYPEFPLNLDQDEQGNLIETEDTRFFRPKPQMLDYDAIISIKAQSILTPSKQINKALDLEFYQQFVPLMTMLAQERMMAMQAKELSDLDSLPHGKTAKELAKLYDKDPRDLFPDAWFIKQEDQQEAPIEDQPLFTGPENVAGQQTSALVPPEEGLGGDQVPTDTGAPVTSQNLASVISGKVTSPVTSV